MFRSLMTRMIQAMEKQLGVEAPYAYHLRDVAPARLWRFSMIKVVEGNRNITSREVYHAAGLGSAMAEDCGPCVQIHVNLAQKDGVAPDILRNLVAHNLAAVPKDVADAFQFGQVVSKGEMADDYRDAVRAKWGEAGLAELAFTVAVARFYPAVKRGLGFAQSCERVVVGDRVTLPRKAA